MQAISLVSSILDLLADVCSPDDAPSPSVNALLPFDLVLYCIFSLSRVALRKHRTIETRRVRPRLVRRQHAMQSKWGTLSDVLEGNGFRQLFRKTIVASLPQRNEEKAAASLKITVSPDDQGDTDITPDLTPDLSSPTLSFDGYPFTPATQVTADSFFPTPLSDSEKEPARANGHRTEKALDLLAHTADVTISLSRLVYPSTSASNDAWRKFEVPKTWEAMEGFLTESRENYRSLSRVRSASLAS